MANLVYMTCGTILATILFLSSTDALNCWSCNSFRNAGSDCNDQANTTAMRNITCSERLHYKPACAKITGKIVGGVQVTERKCVSNYPTYCDTIGRKGNFTRLEGPHLNTVVVTDITCHACTGDNCNSTDRMSVPGITLLLLSALLGYLRC